MLAVELLAGLGLGWLARLVVLALPMAGQIASYMLGLANVLQPDPVLGGQATALERLFATAATVLVFASGLYALPLMALAGSYRVIAPGTPALAGDGAEAVISAIAESFSLAMQLAAPFVLAGTLWQVALGLLARLVPRLQVYFVAMPGQLLGGFVLLGLLATMLLGTWQAAVREGFSRLPGLG
jgi:flagellar biosynthetic protein FliR